jgi:hypothetical protein
MMIRKRTRHEENMQNRESVLMLEGVKRWQCGVAVKYPDGRTMAWGEEHAEALCMEDAQGAQRL